MADESVSSAEQTRSVLGSIPGLCKLLVVVAVGLMGAGVALPMIADTPSTPSTPSSPAATSPTSPDGLVTGLDESADLPGSDAPADADQTAPDQPASPWSGAIFRLGFSFFAGFAIAFALRMVFRAAILFIGLFLLTLMGLQYAGIIEVKWGLLAEHYDTISAWLGAQTQSFTSFVTGYLPSTGSAAAGLAAGFLRKR